MRHIPHHQLEQAVVRGIISQAQLEQLLELEHHPADSDLATQREPRGINPISVAYHLGALLVLFAAAWFLLDRWAQLLPAGVTLVAGAYATAFAVAALLFGKRGFRLAEGVAVTLVVLMVPVIAWGAANLAGVWAPYEVRIPIRPPGAAAWDSGRWLIPQLATIVAALVAARLVRYPLVIAPAAFALWSISIPLTELAFGLTLGGFLVARVSLVIGTVMIAIGYAVDQRTTQRGWAFWIYLFAMLALFVGMIQVSTQLVLVRHLSPLVALAAIAFALRMGQRVFLVGGVLGLIVYLGHLAFDVFSGTAFFPVVLAALGLGIIAGTVWLQRASPRVSALAGGPVTRRVPGHMITMLAPAALALFLLAASIPRERARVQEQLRERERVMEEMERIDRERRETAPERPPGL
jgi:hypothetical protein